ncbi:winged helix family transcriptional regulator [Paenibacillus lutimineralis]|uniref:Winged helix family transcriptional regulator n=1 Tax=Paenibacillus lutimineralis TaxID=2707005 RepID=A0A3S9V167_9BACL|nr:winged helix-turn-helix domain-containing protein [Paenibacillus lutimineralis]AZS16322.1 winged helix family transcriptional regulator [Paenibacillus lutimineralis]
MKKNASFIMMDSSLAKSLYDTVKDLQTNSIYFEGLLQGLEDLMKGEVATLMLGMTRDGEDLIHIVDDGIYAGDLEIHPKSRKVLHGGIEVNLTPKEFDILYFLAKNKGEVFTKEQIYQAVWAENYLMADSNIMAFIRKLRKKIEPNPDAPEYILTIWGIGYKFAD